MSKRTIVVDGVEYAPVKPPSERAVVVVDRGWIFAGDVREENGRIYLTNAVWVFKWSNCGFAAVLSDPSKADIRPTEDVDIPKHSEVFRIPVKKGWGLA